MNLQPSFKKIFSISFLSLFLFESVTSPSAASIFIRQSNLAANPVLKIDDDIRSAVGGVLLTEAYRERRKIILEALQKDQIETESIAALRNQDPEEYYEVLLDFSQGKREIDLPFQPDVVVLKARLAILNDLLNPALIKQDITNSKNSESIVPGTTLSRLELTENEIQFLYERREEISKQPPLIRQRIVHLVAADQSQRCRLAEQLLVFFLKDPETFVVNEAMFGLSWYPFEGSKEQFVYFLARETLRDVFLSLRTEKMEKEFGRGEKKLKKSINENIEKRAFEVLQAHFKIDPFYVLDALGLNGVSKVEDVVLKNKILEILELVLLYINDRIALNAMNIQDSFWLQFFIAVSEWRDIEGKPLLTQETLKPLAKIFVSWIEKASQNRRFPYEDNKNEKFLQLLQQYQTVGVPYRLFNEQNDEGVVEKGVLDFVTDFLEFQPPESSAIADIVALVGSLKQMPGLEPLHKSAIDRWLDAFMYSNQAISSTDTGTRLVLDGSVPVAKIMNEEREDRRNYSVVRLNTATDDASEKIPTTFTLRSQITLIPNNKVRFLADRKLPLNFFYPFLVEIAPGLDLILVLRRYGDSWDQKTEPFIGEIYSMEVKATKDSYISKVETISPMVRAAAIRNYSFNNTSLTPDLLLTDYIRSPYEVIRAAAIEKMDDPGLKFSKDVLKEKFLDCLKVLYMKERDPSALVHFVARLAGFYLQLNPETNAEEKKLINDFIANIKDGTIRNSRQDMNIGPVLEMFEKVKGALDRPEQVNHFFVSGKNRDDVINWLRELKKYFAKQNTSIDLTEEEDFVGRTKANLLKINLRQLPLHRVSTVMKHETRHRTLRGTTIPYKVEEFLCRIEDILSIKMMEYQKNLTDMEAGKNFLTQFVLYEKASLESFQSSEYSQSHAYVMDAFLEKMMAVDVSQSGWLEAINKLIGEVDDYVQREINVGNKRSVQSIFVPRLSLDEVRWMEKIYRQQTGYIEEIPEANLQAVVRQYEALMKKSFGLSASENTEQLAAIATKQFMFDMVRTHLLLEEDKQVRLKETLGGDFTEEKVASLLEGTSDWKTVLQRIFDLDLAPSERSRWIKTIFPLFSRDMSRERAQHFEFVAHRFFFPSQPASTKKEANLLFYTAA